MAKRMKLVDPAVGAPAMTSVVKGFELQGLMTLPEAEKLCQLDTGNEGYFRTQPVTIG